MLYKIGSLFDGSGGFPLAALHAGMRPVWASEIEPYPIAVTRHNLPNMKHLGSVTGVNGAKIEPVDVITFGSPCQDLSVAGKRAGIHDGERSSLFFEAIRIIKEMREATNGKYPAFVVWENVPGAFSSNQGRDFKAVLEAIASAGEGKPVYVPFPEKRRWLSAGEIVGDSYSIAWRVLDAQYWGVPQRRKRIYIVADFAGERAGEILFEREGGSGHFESGEAAREGTADNAPGSAGGSDRVECMINPIVAAFMGGQGEKARGIGYAEETAPTLKSAPSGSNTVPDVVYAIQGNVADRSAMQNGAGISEGVTPTLNSVDRHAVAFDCRNLRGSTECSGTLQAKPNGGYSLNYQSPVVYSSGSYGTLSEGVGTVGTGTRAVNEMVAVFVGNGQLHNISMAEQMNTLDCMHDQQAVLMDGKPPRKYIVRRLTPLECCRLQGFPDGWGDILLKESMTDEDAAFWEQVREAYADATGEAYRPCASKSALVRWYNRLHTDSSEYKMWGNGIALPCAVFVMQGIAESLHRRYGYGA